VSPGARTILALVPSVLASSASGLGRAQIKLIAFTTVLVLSIAFLAVSVVIERIRRSRRRPPDGQGRPPDERSG
jgi:hypothetical protein